MLTVNEQIFNQIKKSQNILITFNKNWNGDAVASALAIYLFLKKLNKNCDLVAENYKQKDLFNFLPYHDKIKNNFNALRKFIISLDITNTKIEKIKYKKNTNSLDFIIFPQKGFFKKEDIEVKSGKFKYDLIITLDSPELESLGDIYELDTEFFYHTTVINIDHKSSNENFGQINLIELSAVSTSEIIYNLLSKYSDEAITEDIATHLLTGLIVKTKNYRTHNITPKMLSISSRLIKLGADREKIVNKLYRSRSINILKLWGIVLTRLTSTLNNKIVWSTITKSDFKETNTIKNDIPEIIDELITNVPTVKIAIIFYELGNSDNPETEIIIYSTKNINPLELMKKWQAKDEQNLTKININKSISEAEKEIITHIKENLKDII
ncbi:DHH family phosphoesterase [Candidatus Parcubacteria bacterium]|nr:DHH family phosphoesterase [Candidatus Parcubacteria bacterium]